MFRVAFALLLLALATAVPVFVMLPLDVISNEGTLSNPDELRGQLSQLKDKANIDGVMTDVWWGLVEGSAKSYDWNAYEQLFQLVADLGLKVQVVMSFHQCGGNVGDTCDIPLPSWVRQIGDSNSDIYYKDREGNFNVEYLSSGVDHEPLFGNRTAVDLYSDYMESFASKFSGMLGSVITEVQVGLGPAGEMRYPSYPLSRWSFCGVGEFQNYDKYLLAQLKKAASDAGHADWGNGGPADAGTYNSRPWDAAFFESGYSSEYGQFFLSWYSKTLLTHGETILDKAKSAFGSKVHLAAKISGIHWWYNQDSHAAELTAGYYNTRDHDGYDAIAAMFAHNNVTFDFTCLEMRNSEQSSDCASAPENLVAQTENAAARHSIGFSGENALPRYDSTAYEEIEHESSLTGRPIDGFTYLRLNNDLLQGDNLDNFSNFVGYMHGLGRDANTRRRVPGGWLLVPPTRTA